MNDPYTHTLRGGPELVSRSSMTDGIYASDLRHVDNAAKMMDTFQKGALALHKLRTGGTQIKRLAEIADALRP